MFEFTGHTGPVNVVEFHPNEYLLASGSSDRYMRGGRKKGNVCLFHFMMPFLVGTWQREMSHNSNLPLQEPDI